VQLEIKYYIALLRYTSVLHCVSKKHP